MSEQVEAKGLNLDIPKISGETFRLALKPGDRAFVVGANGSGKSALIQHVASKRPNVNVWRIPAHRQSWFHSDSVDITARDRLSYATNQFHQDREDEARWTDHLARERQSAILFDLVDSENLRARTITHHIDNSEVETAIHTATSTASPFKRINELLKVGSLAVSLEYSNFERVLARHQNSSKPYSIAEMSDGERSAAIIAARVLTVSPGTTILIDEPERHLHPSISAPFLSALFQFRSDCAFVVSTNDIALPMAHKEAQVLLIHSCNWLGSKAKAWDVELLEANTDLPEDLKRAILGSRKRILFVEGDDSGSLDFPLYDALFPGVSVVPKEGCANVIRAVSGLRGSKNLHHIVAFGLIDRDNRPDEEVERLAEKNIFALDVCSVESLYYCSEGIAVVASHQAASLLTTADDMIELATEKAIESLTRNCVAERMAARRCESHVRNSMLSEIPDWKFIKANPTTKISASISSPYPEELNRIRRLIADKNLDELVSRYPLRESQAFDEIAKALQLTGKENYQRTLLSRLRDDAILAESLRQRVGPLSEALGENQRL